MTRSSRAGVYLEVKWQVRPYISIALAIWEQGSSSVTTVHRHSVVDHQCISVQAMWRASSAGPQPTTFRA